MNIHKPAIIGGVPIFDSPLPILRPNLPEFSEVAEVFSSIMSSGMITNGVKVEEFEHSVASLVGVQHCVAMSSCTSGLVLLLRVSNLRGEIIVPSFTFSATVEAILWAGLIPVFADCLPDTLNLDPQDVKRKIKNETSAILATHIYGNPVNIEGLEELARSSGIKLFIDAAHGFGARYKGQAVGGFGNAEVMSLSPTKLLIAAEGGVVTTNDGDLATHLRWARNYGDPGNYDCQILGLNARMSEFHASLALAGLKGLEQRVTRRNEIAGIYTETLGMLPGVRFQTVSDGDRSSRKDFALFIDESEFGLSRDVLALALEAENIGTRNYYHPPVHEQTFLKAYPHRAEGLEITSRISRQALCVPVYSLLTDGDIGNICQAIIGIHRYAQEIESVSTS